MLSSNEWLSLGAEGLSRDLPAEIAQSRANLQRHLSSLSALFTQLKCPAEKAREILAFGDISQHPLDLERLLNRVTLEVTEKKLKNSCGVLALQMILLSATVTSSVALEAATNVYNLPPDELILADKYDLKAFVKEALSLHVNVLRDALTSSDVLVDDAHLHAGQASEKAVLYLGYLASSVLRTARLIVSPPLALHLNAHLATIALPHASTLAAEARRGGGIGGGLAGKSSSSDRHKVEVARASVARNGESLLEMVRGGSAAEVDVSAAGEEKYWPALLPPLLFPNKIEVVIYVVRLQKKYDPLLGNK